MLLVTVKIKGGLKPPIYRKTGAIRPVWRGIKYTPVINILSDRKKNARDYL
jgi:hypothetical protein